MASKSTRANSARVNLARANSHLARNSASAPAVARVSTPDDLAQELEATIRAEINGFDQLAKLVVEAQPKQLSPVVASLVLDQTALEVETRTTLLYDLVTNRTS